MDLGAVMDDLAVALETVPELRVTAYAADKITPPAATIMWPDELDYDSTMARGSDRATIPVVVAVGRADARSSRDRLAKFADGSGDESVKQCVEAYQPTTYDSARVTRVEFGEAVIAGVTYLGATFYIDIIGTGA